MRVSVRHNLGDLEADCMRIARTAKADMARVVRKDLKEGNTIARRLARDGAGPHGKNYYKRISAEMTGVLSGEYGPEGVPKTDFVGVGFRTGENLDLPNSADLIGPKFARDVAALGDRWFW